MRRWFRTMYWGYRHPDGNPGLLQIHQFRINSKNALTESL
jgi:hypothetical protein